MLELSIEQETSFLTDLLQSEDLEYVLTEIQKRDPNGIWCEFDEDGNGYDPPDLQHCRETIKDWIVDLQS